MPRRCQWIQGWCFGTWWFQRRRTHLRRRRSRDRTPAPPPGICWPRGGHWPRRGAGRSAARSATLLAISNRREIAKATVSKARAGTERSCNRQGKGISSALVVHRTVYQAPEEPAATSPWCACRATTPAGRPRTGRPVSWPCWAGRWPWWRAGRTRGWRRPSGQPHRRSPRTWPRTRCRPARWAAAARAQRPSFAPPRTLAGAAARARRPRCTASRTPPARPAWPGRWSQSPPGERGRQVRRHKDLAGPLWPPPARTAAATCRRPCPRSRGSRRTSRPTGRRRSLSLEAGSQRK